MSLTYKAFTEQIRKEELWKFPGEAKSLVPAHDKFFLEAMIELQRWVPCLQVNHTSVYPACSTYVQCGLTVVEAPSGVIKRVYTVANQEFCDPVYASGRAHKEILQWQKCLMSRFTSPENVGMPALQQGFKFAEASTDSTAGRARTGIWSINRHRLYLAPWLQSNEMLVIEWDGAKKQWLDTDVLDSELWGPDTAAVVKLFVQKSHERDFGCDRQKLRDLEIDFASKLGDLKYWCNERTRNQENQDAEELNVRGPTQAELADDEPLVVADQEIVAYIADYADGPGTVDVAALVNSWNPAYIVTGGDNWYGDAVTLEDLDAQVGPHYGDYIYPYLGTLAVGSERTNNFHPAFSNHDRDPAAREAVMKNYFNLAKPYYDFVRGHVHWFIVDGGYRGDKVNVYQPDGNAFNSVQGEAFKLKMALSTARWKIVVVGFPPYVSGQGFPALRWPYKAWGADLVMSGDKHAYERLTAPEGYPLIIGGWSGRSLDAADADSPYMALRYATDYGAVKLTASCDELKVEAINRVGVTVDTLTLEKT